MTAVHIMPEVPTYLVAAPAEKATGEKEDGCREEILRNWRRVVHKWLHKCDIEDAVQEWMHETEESKDMVSGRNLET
jgi:hypothetical protein